MSRRQEFLDKAKQSYRVAEQERGLRDGSLIRLPGTDACLPRTEAEEFERDLTAQGLAIVKPGEDRTDAASVYLPDGRNCVLVRPLAL